MSVSIETVQQAMVLVRIDPLKGQKKDIDVTMSFLADYEGVKKFIEKLRNEGVWVSGEDHGTWFPPQRIKQIQFILKPPEKAEALN